MEQNMYSPQGHYKGKTTSKVVKTKGKKFFFIGREDKKEKKCFVFFCWINCSF